MPALDGFDVLGWIKTKPELQNLPVVIVSASDFERDKELAFALAARDFFQKSVALGTMIAQFKAWKARSLAREADAC